VLLEFCDEIGFHLAEDFYWFNPAKLPSPIEWVNKRKIRAKDAVNTVWWLSKTPFPTAFPMFVAALPPQTWRAVRAETNSVSRVKRTPDRRGGWERNSGNAVKPM
jgi:hypothetical protein